MDTTTIILPPDMPLFATTERVSKLFGIGRTRLYELRRDYPELQAMTIKTGKQVLYNVPTLYQWFQDRCGGELD